MFPIYFPKKRETKYLMYKLISIYIYERLYIHIINRNSIH